MTISYKWLLDYLPVPLDPEKICSILNSIGLEVEDLRAYEEVKGGLRGLVIGHVLDVQKHPNADKLSLTTVDVGGSEPLRIVCGAPNVAAGQKVVVAPVGATLYPASGDPLTMRVARIRGEESHGMICAEDETGLGPSHDGIMVLDPGATIGMPAADHFMLYEDHIIEIGLTPNRSDAMSHMGVARDICAWLSHHEGGEYPVKDPFPESPGPAATKPLPVSVRVEDRQGCARYSGITITGVKVGPGPDWIAKRLKAIGVRPINNIVDITNYVLHETGQPLHAFDADRIEGGGIIVRTLPEGTGFLGLDDKERKLHQEDLAICNAASGPMCLAGVFGGRDSGVSDGTSNLFLESAWFHPSMIRRTSFRHNLRTDAATHFEKSVDIGNTVHVLKRAASLICGIAGGHIASDIVDVYPEPAEPKQVTISYAYLRKLSGKEYAPATVKQVMRSLGFGLVKDTGEALTLSVPTHKTDVSLPADLAEEVMRIDGFDNIAIPASITITPSTEANAMAETQRERISAVLVGMGFSEIMNNSITNSAYLTEEEKGVAVKMMNNLSAELDVLRVSMLETGLHTVLHNLNRKNNNLKLYEFGKTYATSGAGHYEEKEHLALFVTGKSREENWHVKPEDADIYYLKGVAEALLKQLGLHGIRFAPSEHAKLGEHLQILSGQQVLGYAGRVKDSIAGAFGIRQDVHVLDLFWDKCLEQSGGKTLRYREIPKYPAVQRDLAFVVEQSLAFAEVEQVVNRVRIERLRGMKLFDVFESEKLGAGRKSMALSFTFQDEEKTLTDKDIDEMMQKIIVTFEKELNAEIRKS
jgi:phenylalanyl-tRNA synthetase beta chain